MTNFAIYNWYLYKFLTICLFWGYFWNKQKYKIILFKIGLWAKLYFYYPCYIIQVFVYNI